MLEEVLTWITNGFIIATGVGIWAFTVSYIAFFKSEVTPAGRALRDLAVAMSLVFGLIFVGVFASDFWGRPWLRLLVYGALAFTAIRLVFTLWGYRKISFPEIPSRDRTSKSRPWYKQLLGFITGR